MTKLWLALCFGLSLGIAPAQAQTINVPATQVSIPIVGGITAGLILITGKANQRIYVTSLELAPASTSVVQFIQGTGAACGTNSSAVTGSYVFGGQTLSAGSGYGAILVLAPGNSLCIIVTTAAAPGSLSYSQY